MEQYDSAMHVLNNVIIDSFEIHRVPFLNDIH